MANTSRKFKSTTGSYSGGYTSYILEPTHKDLSVHMTRGIIQIHVISGNVSLEVRLHREAPWFVLKEWTVDAIEELVLANQLRVVVSDEAHCWLGEIL